MNNNIIIRNESSADYRAVEHLTREAFWNQYVQGCDEHYFVHVMRSHPDFVPELAFVLERDGELIGNVMYTKSRLVDEAGETKEILSFGPVCIHPDYQRQGYGKLLLEHSFEKARELGYEAIVIFGNPTNYVRRGFVSCHRHNICLDGGYVPMAMLVKELKTGALDGRRWYFHESSASAPCADEQAVAAFDAQFPPKEKKWQPSQEEFYIHCRSGMQMD